MKRLVPIWMVVLVAAIGIACSGGGGESGSIAGVVTDLVDRPLAGMRVGIVSGTATFPEIAPETDDGGSYQINSVPPGTFQVAIHDRNGQRVGLESVVVNSGETATLDFSLAGEAAEQQARLPQLPSCASATLDKCTTG